MSTSTHAERDVSWAAVCALLLSAGLSTAALADAAPSTVTPVPGAPLIFGHAEFDLGTVGYTQSEFFYEGTADAYGAPTPLTSDGKWTATPSHEAEFKTRMVVNRPSNPRRFNGTVLVEWLNVSGGVDASPDWQHTHAELIRRGYAWVGVSAQAVGVNQLKCPTPPTPACPNAPSQGGPVPGDPARYGTLNHPGDSFSYDIFSQAGQAIRDHADVVLGGLRPEVLIAAGESQSAGRLVTYIDAVHPLHHVYDGFFVHSRGAGGASLRQAPQTPAIATPSPTYIRDDLDVPVIVFQAETDVGGVAARQPDSDSPLKYRLYEVAGTSHFDLYGLVQAAVDTGSRESVADWFDSMLNPDQLPVSGVRLRVGDQQRAGDLRRASLDLAPRPLDPTRHPTSEGVSPRDDQPVAGDVRGGSSDGHRARRRPHTGRRRAGGAAQRDGAERYAVLRVVRHHRAVHGTAARGALPEPWSLRVRLEPCHAQGDLRRVRAARRRHRHRGRRRPIRHPEVAARGRRYAAPPMRRIRIVRGGGGRAAGGGRVLGGRRRRLRRPGVQPHHGGRVRWATRTALIPSRRCPTRSPCPSCSCTASPGRPSSTSRRPCASWRTATPQERIVAYDHDGAGVDIAAYTEGLAEVIDATLAEHEVGAGVPGRPLPRHRRLDRVPRRSRPGGQGGQVRGHRWGPVRGRSYRASPLPRTTSPARRTSRWRRRRSRSPCSTRSSWARSRRWSTSSRSGIPSRSRVGP